jgi:hypothetical protein
VDDRLGDYFETLTSNAPRTQAIVHFETPALANDRMIAFLSRSRVALRGQRP